MTASPKKLIPARTYPGKVAIRHAAEAAIAIGIDPAGLEIAPGGVIRILDRSAILPEPKDEFEQWDAAGKL